ncbi:hypothetical protein RHS01_11182 [Rhizoctonia solani]|uniref:Uncharacterized protein n=1 Tax=Rhizoctonia solani TaxID=456999 RepID=A0A8H7LZU9_9AGAM|nr:hypothetical protein RHS01_11182 [Rhizoctonia solani]
MIRKSARLHKKKLVIDVFLMLFAWPPDPDLERGDPDYNDSTGDYVNDSAWEGSKVGRLKHARGKGKEKIVKKPEVIVQTKDEKHIELTQTESTPQFYDGEAYLFLLVGPPPQDPEVLQLVHAFADSVHSRAGAVICLSKVPLPGTKYDYIISSWKAISISHLGKFCGQWNRWLPWKPMAAPPRLANSNLCYFEGMYRLPDGKGDLVQGQLSLYCHRQVDNNSKDNDPEELDSGNDDFAYHNACLIFDFFSQEGTRSIEDAKKSLCAQIVGTIVRMVCTRYGCLLSAGVLASHATLDNHDQRALETAGMGGFSMRLQHLQDRSNVTAQLQWEAGSFQFMAVFITHGLTEDQGYQLDDSKAVPPLNLLQLTLPVAQTAVNGANLTLVFFFACGHPMMSPTTVSMLQDWVNK